MSKSADKINYQHLVCDAIQKHCTDCIDVESDTIDFSFISSVLKKDGHKELTVDLCKTLWRELTNATHVSASKKRKALGDIDDEAQSPREMLQMQVRDVDHNHIAEESFASRSKATFNILITPNVALSKGHDLMAFSTFKKQAKMPATDTAKRYLGASYSAALCCSSHSRQSASNHSSKSGK
jgi:hypothetical protein